MYYSVREEECCELLDPMRASCQIPASGRPSPRLWPQHLVRGLLAFPPPEALVKSDVCPDQAVVVVVAAVAVVAVHLRERVKALHTRHLLPLLLIALLPEISFRQQLLLHLGGARAALKTREVV